MIYMIGMIIYFVLFENIMQNLILGKFQQPVKTTWFYHEKYQRIYIDHQVR